MPTTLTRNYPYPPIIGEAPNAAVHLQQLAEAVDTDLTAVVATMDTTTLAQLATKITELENQAILLAARVTQAESTIILTTTVEGHLNKTLNYNGTNMINSFTTSQNITLPGTIRAAGFKTANLSSTIYYPNGGSTRLHPNFWLTYSGNVLTINASVSSSNYGTSISMLVSGNIDVAYNI